MTAFENDIRSDIDPSRYEHPRLVFDDGALVLKGVAEDEAAALELPAAFIWHMGHWAAPAYQYAALRGWLDTHAGSVTNHAPHYLYTPKEFVLHKGPPRATKGENEQERDNALEKQRDVSHPKMRVAEVGETYTVGEMPKPETSATIEKADPFAAFPPSALPQTPRPYQQEAIESWLALDGRGTIVLPTGAGKSFVATLAIDAMRAPTLVVVPQLDLMHQWYETLCAAYGAEWVGVYYGAKKDVRPLTVTTYVSAATHLDELGNLFYLLICDEVHHLTAATWQQAAKLFLAPKRLALTATYPTDFDDHSLLQELIGPPCYYKAPADLAGTYLAEYETIKLRVALTDNEAADYERHKAIYAPWVKRMWQRYRQRWYGVALGLQNRDADARQAMVAKSRMAEIIEFASAKRHALARILALHHGQSAIIFTETNKAVYDISEAFMLPAITHQTPTAERKAILDSFRAGDFPAIVTARVLNEGVDLPTAKVAIIVGGGSGSTEYIQRLGRILRRQGGARAFLYEVIVRDTLEEGVSSRRKMKRDAKPGDHPNEANTAPSKPTTSPAPPSSSGKDALRRVRRDGAGELGSSAKKRRTPYVPAAQTTLDL